MKNNRERTIGSTVNTRHRSGMTIYRHYGIPLQNYGEQETICRRSVYLETTLKEAVSLKPAPQQNIYRKKKRLLVRFLRSRCSPRSQPRYTCVGGRSP